MRIALLLFAVLLLPAAEPSEKDHAEWMKTIGQSMGSLKKSVAEGQPEAIAAQARHLEESFHRVREFWGKRDASDAVRFARQAETSAAAIAKLAAAGDLKSVAEPMEDLAASCGGCHNVHRYRLPGGGFRIF